ncbi:FUSC family protein [Flavobacterium rhizosphaerae]|uniref:FUSC family membrane protein n=2 Tax=Flavobacterium TaxID=237 RepID=A0ABW8YVI8_9FLAO
MLQKLKEFTDSVNFTRAVVVTVAAVLPAVGLSLLGYSDIAFTVALGALLVYPADIPSNMPHRIRGLLVAAVIVAGSTLMVNLLYDFKWLFYPLVTLLVFFLSMLSVFGQRATMISFSGLLAIALGTGHLHSGAEMFTNALLMFGGGLFYMLLSVTFNILSPYRYTELQIADCLRLTSKYLKLRGDLWTASANRDEITKKQLDLQVEINTIHDNLREVLMRNRSNAGGSTRNRRMLLAFISLVEILELALSTSFDHTTLHQKFDGHSEILNTYQNLAYNMAARLKKMSRDIIVKRKLNTKHSLKEDLVSFRNSVTQYAKAANSAAENVWMLMSMQHYAENQIRKIDIIEKSFTYKLSLRYLDKNRYKEVYRFIEPEYFPLKTLWDNLSFSSAIFRLSLRLALSIALGFVIGALMPLQNVYWILLTIVVIMRPGYGLTKKRSYHRIAGTILGGIIAFAFLSVFHQPVIIGTLAIVAMLLGYTFTAINYRVGATFITIYVIFLYSMLTPDINKVIQYRVLDTLVGALLAFLGNYFFWPSWEFMNVPGFIKKAIEANQEYLKQIAQQYNKKGAVTTEYRLARKNAFVSLGNLMSSYQRMLQEPKSKQKQQHHVYKLAVLNHTMLSSLASMGTFIQNHKTYEASPFFNKTVTKILDNLQQAVTLISMDVRAEAAVKGQDDEAAQHFNELKNIRAKELETVADENEDEYNLKMEEAHLITEQLAWLNSLSERIAKSVANLKI